MAATPRLWAVNAPAGAESDDDDPPIIWDEPEEDDEPSVIEYQAACASCQVVRCSQWQRACVSKAVEVSLCHYGLGKRGAETLARSLKQNVHIRSLDIGDNGLGAEGVAYILGALRDGGAPALRLLSLRQNQCGEEGADAVAELLRGGEGMSSPQHPLESIHLGDNAIGTKGAIAIGEALACNVTITALNLEHNDIESEGASRLCEKLGENSTLTSLSLEWNQLGPPAGDTFGDALRAEKLALTSLNLGWNGLGDAGVAAIARAIEERPTFDGPMCDLRLHHNRMSAESAVPLSRSLGGLSVLDVSGNALGTAGGAVLLLAQQELRMRTDKATGEEKPHRCQVMMEDICVRPDTALAGLLTRASAGEELTQDEMSMSGVHKAAAIAVRSRAATAPGAKERGGGKGGGKDGKKWDPHHAQKGGGGEKLGSNVGVKAPNKAKQ
jgi:hypothetical protein